MGNISSDKIDIPEGALKIARQLLWWKVAIVITYSLIFLLPASLVTLNVFYSYTIFLLVFLSSTPWAIYFQVLVYASLIFIVPLYITKRILALESQISSTYHIWIKPVYTVVFVVILWTAGSVVGTLPGSPLNRLQAHQSKRLSEERISDSAKERFESIEMLLATYYIYEKEYPTNLMQLVVKIPDANNLLGTDLLSSQSVSYDVTPDKMSYTLCIRGENSSSKSCSTPTFESKQKRDQERDVELRYIIAEIYNNGFNSTPRKSFKPILNAANILPAGIIGYESTPTGFRYCISYELKDKECINETSELTVQFRDYARQRRLFDIISYLKEYHDLNQDTRLQDIEIWGLLAHYDIFSTAREGYTFSYDGTVHSGRTNTFTVCVNYESIGNTCVNSWKRIRHIPEFFK